MAANEQERYEREWHLDKRWHIAQIVGMLVMCATAIAFVVQRDGQFDKRVSMLEATQLSQRERDTAQDRAFTEALAQVRRYLERIEDKIDGRISSK